MLRGYLLLKMGDRAQGRSQLLEQVERASHRAVFILVLLCLDELESATSEASEKEARARELIERARSLAQADPESDDAFLADIAEHLALQRQQQKGDGEEAKARNAKFDFGDRKIHPLLRSRLRK